MMEKFLVGLAGGAFLAVIAVVLICSGMWAVDHYGGWGLVVYIVIAFGVMGGLSNLKDTPK